MSNFKKERIDLSAPRTELHDLLALTGAEVSVNTLPAGASVPFVHSHQANEEIYLVLEGEGRVYLDGDELPLVKGDCLRVDPACRRCLAASAQRALTYLCIQAKAGSLAGFTMGDGMIDGGVKPSWL
jgi:uncharacterized cupin superfamily protein